MSNTIVGIHPSSQYIRAIAAFMAAFVLISIACVVHSPPASAAPPRTVSSTAYCDHGTMANGQATHNGAVAMNGVRFGTKFKVLSGPKRGMTVQVKDRIGHSSQFDLWVGSCSEAINYGRKTIKIQQVG